MDVNAFRRSLDDDEPPKGLNDALRALWHVGRDQWDRAHRIVQSHDDADSCWIHAHLHRVEGDLSNAAYWYTRAGRAVSKRELRAEWEEIVGALLGSER